MEVIGDDPLSAMDHVAVACEELYRKNALVWIALGHGFKFFHILVILDLTAICTSWLCKACALQEIFFVNEIRVKLVRQLQ